MLKKVFAATLAGLFITAPAFANIENYGADKQAYENSDDFRGMKMSGSFWIKGNNNQSLSGTSERNYESDFDVTAQFVVSEKTAATLSLEALDTKWGGNDYLGSSSTKGQDYLEVTKATINHTFDTGTTFYGGVHGNGEAWGTNFGEGQDRVYFLQLDQTLPMGTLTLRTEKLLEQDLPHTNAIDTGGNDVDSYLLGLTTKLGNFTVQPAVFFRNNNAAPVLDADDNITKYRNADQEITRLMVAFDGKIGAIGLSGEFGYEDRGDDKLTKAVGTNKNDESASVYALWVDAATTVASLGLNAGLYYSPADDDAAYLDGTNLCPMEILGDALSLSGMTLFRVKANKAITDKISVDASVAYAATNFDDKYIEAESAKAFESGYELNANASFKASDAVTVSCGYAYLDGDTYDGAKKKTVGFDEAIVESYVKVAVVF